MYWYVIYRDEPSRFELRGKRFLLPTLGITKALRSEVAAEAEAGVLEEEGIVVLGIRSSESKNPYDVVREWGEEEDRLESVYKDD